MKQLIIFLAIMVSMSFIENNDGKRPIIYMARANVYVSKKEYIYVYHVLIPVSAGNYADADDLFKKHLKYKYPTAYKIEDAWITKLEYFNIITKDDLTSHTPPIRSN